MGLGLLVHEYVRRYADENGWKSSIDDNWENFEVLIFEPKAHLFEGTLQLRFLIRGTIVSYKKYAHGWEETKHISLHDPNSLKEINNAFAFTLTKGL